MIPSPRNRLPWLFVAACIVPGLIGIGCARRRAAQAPATREQALNLYVESLQAYQSGDTQGAIKDLERATKANPDLIMARSKLGDLYRAQGDFEKALPQYEVLAQNDPYGVNNHYRLGLTYQLLNRLKEAAAAYLRALELDPKDPLTNMHLGLVYLALDQTDDALKYLRRATDLAPDTAEVWANLGAALDVKGDAPAAEAAYRKSLELNGLQDSTLLNLAFNLIAQRKASEAVSVMEQLIQRMNTPVSHRAYGDALTLANRFDEAIAQYDEALKLDRNYYPALNEKGNALIRRYQKGLELDDEFRNAAIDAWKQSLALYSQQPHVEALIRQWSNNRLFGGR